MSSTEVRARAWQMRGRSRSTRCSRCALPWGSSSRAPAGRGSRGCRCRSTCPRR
jgi:hypothetical protein